MQECVRHLNGGLVVCTLAVLMTLAGCSDTGGDSTDSTDTGASCSEAVPCADADVEEQTEDSSTPQDSSTLQDSTSDSTDAEPEDTAEPMPDIPPADTTPLPDVMETEIVGADAPMVDSRTACVSLGAQERLAAVSPEGDAWLMRQEDGAVTVRVVDPEGTELVAATRLELPAVTLVRAWSSTYANIVATDTLWRLEALQRIVLTPPSRLGEPQSWCGELGGDGMLLGGDGTVFEARDNNWLAWRVNVPEGQVPVRFVERQGECFGPDNVLWALSGDGTLWQIREADARPLQRFEALIDAAATNDTLVVVDGETLWVGPEPWLAWAFETEVPARLSASSRHVWMVLDGRLLRLEEDADAFVAVELALDGAVVGLYAHDGGVWAEGEQEICHHATEPRIGVVGVRPFERTRAAEVTFEVNVASEMAVEATLDGEPVMLRNNNRGTLMLETEGWHALGLRAEGPSGIGNRT
ncbi:MAG: hypothetical protein AAFS10_14030, partial [Myxococcota bacterium]